MAGLLPEGPEQRLPQRVRLGDFVMNVTYERPAAAQGAGQQNPGVQTSPISQSPTVLSGGLVIAIGPGEFVFAGTGMTVTFEAETPAIHWLAYFPFMKVSMRMVNGMRVDD